MVTSQLEPNRDFNLAIRFGLVTASATAAAMPAATVVVKNRIGTPAMTTRGLQETEAELVAHLIVDVLEAPNSEASISKVLSKVKVLMAKYPVYG